MNTYTDFAEMHADPLDPLCHKSCDTCYAINLTFCELRDV